MWSRRVTMCVNCAGPGSVCQGGLDRPGGDHDWPGDREQVDTGQDCAVLA